MYQRKDDTVTLTMTVEEYESLLMALGYALGFSNNRGNLDLFSEWIKLANSLNKGNPKYTPYEVPKA